MIQTCQWPLNLVKMLNQEKSFLKKRVSISKFVPSNCSLQYVQWFVLLRTLSRRYNEAIWSSAHHQADRRLHGWWILHCHGAGSVWRGNGIRWRGGLGMLSVGKLGKPPSVPNMRGTLCMTFQKSYFKRVDKGHITKSSGCQNAH